MNSNSCFSGISDYNTQAERKLKYDKQYQQDNKEKITIKRSIKSVCECSGTYTLSNKSQHFKSKKHQNYLANLKEVIV